MLAINLMIFYISLVSLLEIMSTYGLVFGLEKGAM
jgi:hypothetical protein